MTPQPVCDGTLAGGAGGGNVCVEQGPAWLVEAINTSSLIWLALGVVLAVMVGVAVWNYRQGFQRTGVGSEVVWNATFALGCLVGTAIVASLLSLPYLADVGLGVAIAFVWAELATRTIDAEEIDALSQLE